MLDLSAELIDLDASEVDAGIRRALAVLGRFVEADRAYVFLLRDGGAIADNTHEWCAPGIEEAVSRLQGLALDDALPWFAPFMRRHVVFHVPRVAELPAEAAAERAEFEAEGIRSLLVVPMVHRDALLGFLGFDAVRAERRWSREDIALLRVAGQILIAALQAARVKGKLRRSEDRYRSLVEHSCDWVWEVDAACCYTYASPKSLDFVGLEPAALLGRSRYERVAPEHVQRLRATFERHLVEGCAVNGVETELEHRDGRRVWVETSGVPLLDEHGRAVGCRCIDRDITARKLAEQERRDVEQHLRETQKLESVGLLAGGIAHDFNNLLTGILGQASLARRELKEGDPSHARFELIEQAALRAAELTRQLLAYSGRASFVQATVGLAELVRELRPLLEISIAKHCSLDLDLASDTPTVHGDPSQLRQILMNLVINASEAAPVGLPAVIRVSTGASRRDAEAASHDFFEPAPSGAPVAFLAVSDDGPGMATELLQRAFEPFFSTKAVGRGLGLAAVLGIVRSHRGALSVESAPGFGTRFRVALPASEHARSAADVEPADVPRTGATVLVVDDDPMVRNVAVAILEGDGHRTLAAAGGREAERIYAERTDEIGLVLLDMTMPDLDGVEVLARLRAIRPAVRVLVASGFGAEEMAERFAAAPPLGFLQKPFSATALSDAVARAMS